MGTHVGTGTHSGTGSRRITTVRVCIPVRAQVITRPQSATCGGPLLRGHEVDPTGCSRAGRRHLMGTCAPMGTSSKCGRALQAGALVA